MNNDQTWIDPTWMQKTGGFAKDMTMRDYYAGKAVEYVSWNINTFELSAERCYAMADAMLKAREAK
jgi:hypothetical protein